MPDQFSEVTKKISYPQKVLASFFGVIVGLAFFVGSLFLLYYNEGRTDISTIAAEAIAINAEQANPEADGKLVAASGQVTGSAAIGDNLFLAPGNYVVLDRIAEMYAWTEDKSTHEDADGDETTTYTYKKEWTRVPEDSARFHVTAGHENPSLPFKSDRFFAPTAKIGIYDFDHQAVTLPGLPGLSLTKEIVTLKNGAILGEDNYIRIYKDKNASTTENIGDVRVSYQIMAAGTQGTLFGKLNGNQISTYLDTKNNKLFRLMSGSKEEGVAAMHTEFVVMTWVLRLIGFCLMWVGLTMIFGPISAVLGVIPFLGNASACVVGLAMFVVAAVLSAIVIFVSMVVHSWVFLLLVLFGVIALVYLGFKKMKQQSADQMPSGQSQ